MSEHEDHGKNQDSINEIIQFAALVATSTIGHKHNESRISASISRGCGDGPPSNGARRAVKASSRRIIRRIRGLDRGKVDALPQRDPRKRAEESQDGSRLDKHV